MKNKFRIVCLLILVLLLSTVLFSCNKEKTETVDGLVLRLNNFGNFYYYSIIGVEDKSITEITFPNEYNGIPITTIDRDGFSDCTSLTSITIPDSVTSIENGAFRGCTGLTEVCITDLAAWCKISFGDYAANPLSFVHKLYINGVLATDITVPDSVTSIDSYAFSGCTGLTSVTIPDSVTSIGKGAFSGCSSLISMTLPFVGGSIKTAEDTYQYPFGYIFGEDSYTGGTEVLQSYYASSTTSTTYTDYYIPSSLNSVTVTGGNILYGAFYNCSMLTSITIGNSVKSIGDRAFNNCSGLTSFTIPDSVTSIGYGAFSDCSGLISMTLPFVGGSIKTADDTYQYPFGYIFGGYSYYNTGGTKIQQYYYGSSTTSTTYGYYYIPSSLKSVTITGGNILYGAFKDCSMLTSITIGNCVTSIGKSAFDNCLGLTSVTIGNSVKSIGSYAFSNCYKLVQITNLSNISLSGLPNNIGLEIRTSIDTPFVNTLSTDNDGLVTYAVGEKKYISRYTGSSTALDLSNKDITDIYPYAFYGCTELTSVTIPDSVTSIGEDAFRYCTGLTSVTIPNSVKSIGNYAFYNCTGLKEVHISDLAAWCKISFGDYEANPLYYARKLYINGILATDITIPDRVTSIGDRAFYRCSGLTSVTIPNSVTSIGDGAFYRCSGLTSVTIPNSVTSIGDYAFERCGALTYIDIPNSVTSIGDKAFGGPQVTIGLRSIVIPISVAYIGNEAFYACGKLKTIYCEAKSQPAYWDSSWKVNCGATVIWGYNNITTNDIYDYVVHDEKIYLTKYKGAGGVVDIPSSIDGKAVVGISEVFTGNTLITSVTIPDSVKSIGESAFKNCSGLTSVTIPDSVTSIGDGAFEDCDGLTSVTIPDSVTSIGEGVFRGCSGLVSMTLPFLGGSIKTADDTYQYPFGYIFGENSYNGGTQIKQYYYGSSTTSTAYDFYYIPSSLKSVTITGGNILYGAFYNCSILTSIIIGNSVKSIGNRAFSHCTELTSIIIPDSVTSIGNYAFEACTGITRIDYNGTMAQWNAIRKGYGWNNQTGAYKVYCTDGEIEK